LGRRPGMADGRRTRLWGLVAERAGARAGPVSAGDACEVAAAVAEVDGGWLSVMSDPARRALVHATSRRAAEVDELQFTLGEGPCTDAFRWGRPVLVADLGAVGWRERWPGFTIAGVTAEAAAVFAFPLVLGAIRVGVLGLYRKTAGPLSPSALADVLVCADTALQLLLNSRAGMDGDGDGQPGDGWSDDHAQVYQATGMVSAQRAVGPEEALALLRAHAFAHDLTLDEVAAAVVARRLRLGSGETGGQAG
jgi:GAF domain-containing protein/ANTAR domain-containing protein